jgi:thiamine-monophosphate kinase
MVSEDDFVDRLVALTGGDDSYVGDDCAILERNQSTLLATVDSLVESIHFPSEATPTQIARKLARVNLSDIAAMGGEPLWALLSEGSGSVVDERAAFAGKLVEALSPYSVPLVGGDITSVPDESGKFYSLTVIGEASGGTVLRRSNANPGDLIAVSGELGGPRAALSQDISERTDKENKLLYSPPVTLALGKELVQNGFTCAIDLSDGLVKDLGRVCRAAGLGAKINWKDVPVNDLVHQRASGIEERLRWTLGGGEDYELLIAVPPERKNRLPDRCTIIGTFINDDTIQFEPTLPNGINPSELGYDHFS